jgi:plastocyanin
VSLRACHPLHCVAVLALGAIVTAGMFAGAPAAWAQQQTASFVAGDNFWTRTAGVGSSGSNASIFTGGTVSFSNGGNNPHNVTFTASQQPSVCTPTLPMPGPPTTQDWSGTCTFNSPGSYSFLCQQHSSVMTGSVQVVNPPTGGPPPGGGNPPPGGGNPPGGGGGGSGGNEPGASPTQPGSPKISFARKQTGTTVRGTVDVSARAKIVVTALVSNRYLSTRRPKKLKKVTAGAQTKRSNGGKVRFAVKLRAAARRALERREKLTVSLRIVVTPPSGEATTRTIKVTLRPA